MFPINRKEFPAARIENKPNWRAFLVKSTTEEKCSVEKNRIMSSDKSGYILIWNCNGLIVESGFRWDEPIYNLKKVHIYIVAMIYDETENNKIRDKGYVIVYKKETILVHRLNLIGTSIEAIPGLSIAFGSSSSFIIYKNQAVEDASNTNLPIMIDDDKD